MDKLLLLSGKLFFFFFFSYSPFRYFWIRMTPGILLFSLPSFPRIDRIGGEGERSIFIVVTRDSSKNISVGGAARDADVKQDTFLTQSFALSLIIDG